MTYNQPLGQTPASMTLTVSVAGKHAAINANDHFGSLEIYNAKAYGLDTGAYSVVATVNDQPKPLADAVYHPPSDRLVAGATAGDVVDLTQVTAITLTRKA